MVNVKEVSKRVTDNRSLQWCNLKALEKTFLIHSDVESEKKTRQDISNTTATIGRVLLYVGILEEGRRVVEGIKRDVKGGLIPDYTPAENWLIEIHEFVSDHPGFLHE